VGNHHKKSRQEEITFLLREMTDTEDECMKEKIMVIELAGISGDGDGNKFLVKP
jgi:hypothetical protein